ncbi:MAG: hypothetical protein ACVCEJ_01705 [Candidatus Izemoplasmataceae bacterium]
MKIYETLKKHLDDGNLEQSVLYSIDVIKNKKISIVDLGLNSIQSATMSEEKLR